LFTVLIGISTEDASLTTSLLSDSDPDSSDFYSGSKLDTDDADSKDELSS